MMDRLDLFVETLEKALLAGKTPLQSVRLAREAIGQQEPPEGAAMDSTADSFDDSPWA